MDNFLQVNRTTQGGKYSNMEDSENWYPNYDYDADNSIFYVPPSYDGEIEASERESSSVGVTLQTSRSRYRVLFIYILCSLFQFYLISSLNPLTKTNAPHGNEDEAIIQVDLSVFTLCFLIPVLLTAFPLSLLLRKYGLKDFLVGGSFISCLASAFRCVLVSAGIEKGNANILIITQVFIAVGTTMILVCPSYLSTQWFPVHERRFATGASLMSLYLGLGLGFICSNELVESLSDDGVQNLQDLFLGQTCVGVFLFWVLYFFFPGVTRSAPSVLQRSQRLPVGSSLKAIKGKRRLWLCLISATFTSGSYFFMFYHVSWIAYHVGFYENLGSRSVLCLYAFFCVFFGMFVAFAVIKCSDRCHFLFGTIMVTCSILTINLIILSLIVTVFEDSLGASGRKIFMILDGIISFACVVIISPLFSEFIADFMYPVPEETTFALFTCTQVILPTILSAIVLAGSVKNDRRFSKGILFVMCGITFLGTVIFATLAKTKNKRKPLERGTRPRQSFGPNKDYMDEDEVEIGI